MSLSRLATDTAMSKATLSGIESGWGNPTVDTLTVLAEALRVSISELFDTPASGEVRIVRASEAEPIAATEMGLRLLEQADNLSGNLELLEFTIPAHRLELPITRVSGARDALLVLQGHLIAGPLERISELASGDYASFPADGPYMYEAARSTVRALVLRYTPR